MKLSQRAKVCSLFCRFDCNFRSAPVNFRNIDATRVDVSGCGWVCGTLLSMAPAKRRPDTSWLPTVVPTLQSLLDHGEATRGMTVKTWGGHLVLGRVDAQGPDPRFRLTPLGGGFMALRPQPVARRPQPDERGQCKQAG
jgi:hypothetical protein